MHVIAVSFTFETEKSCWSFFREMVCKRNQRNCLLLESFERNVKEEIGCDTRKLSNSRFRGPAPARWKGRWKPKSSYALDDKEKATFEAVSVSNVFPTLVNWLFGSGNVWWFTFLGMPPKKLLPNLEE